MTNFQELYRKCKRQHKLHSKEDLQDFIGLDAVVSEVTINSNIQINGFRIETGGEIAFFPKKECFPENSSYVAKLRETFYTVTVVVPPLITVEELDVFSNAVKSDSKNISHEFGKWYPTEFIARLYCCHYQNNNLTEKYLRIIKQSIEAFHFGLYSVSIVSLIPCIEGLIRDIGMRIEVNCSESVGVKDLINVLEKLQKRVINEFVFHGYDWIPSDFKSVKFHDQFNEVVQLIESIKFVVENDYYSSTGSYSNDINLNRNAIVHGFVTDFDDKANFYRLLTIINSLVLLTGYIGESVSFLISKHTEESVSYCKKLNNIKKMSVELVNA
ncbi:hypothetical protein Q8W40_13900 [Vibrio penaeicida]|uniref:hypothetical protein n=1 Tax=Vibrio penaeicida TaxID=104609 RepID=UPI0027337A3F|nr:hypothetical protein [Vibrio penaeicida]MDP2573280.1 hypothetical protein [Vibrio penaeicida]